MTDSVSLLAILQLADSQTPIGAAAHSFGLEGLTADQGLTVDDLADFLRGYLAEAGALEADFCRDAYAMADSSEDAFDGQWTRLNQELSAWKMSRESRTASATLGRRFLRLAAGLSGAPLLAQADLAARQAGCDIHHATAFGLVGGALGWGMDGCVVAYLQQNVAALVSAAQRLLPLGQTRAARLIWDLQGEIVNAASPPQPLPVGEGLGRGAFTPWLEIASMRHPALTTRLFIS